MAVQCAQLPTIEYILFQLHLNPNLPEADTGNTPLHWAVLTNRLDAAQLLLSHPAINDTIPNKEGKTPLQLVTSYEMMGVLQKSRSDLRALIQRHLEEFETLAMRGAPTEAAEQALVKLISLPRVTSVDLAVTSSHTGKDVLHTAVKYKSLDLIKVSISHGADPYVKDMSGQSANDMTKDEQIRSFIRQLVHTGAANSVAHQQMPVYRGCLEKWTNYMHGYKMRWFVLENGVLSYYRGPEDEGRQTRGVMHMRYVTVVPDRKERNRFEVISGQGKDALRWFLRSNDVAECTRWIQLLEKARNAYQQGEASASGDASAFNAPSTLVSGAATMEDSSSVTVPDAFVNDDMSEAGTIEDSGLEEGSGTVPYSANFNRIHNLMNLRFEVALKLVDELDSQMSMNNAGAPSQPMQVADTSKVVIPPAASPGQAAMPVSFQSTTSQASDAGSKTRAILRESLQEQAQIWKQLAHMVQDRETYLVKELERVNRTCQLWEEQMTVLGEQHKQLENELKEAASEIKQLRKERRQFASQLPLHEEPASMSKEEKGDTGLGLGATAGVVSATAGAAAGMAGSMLSKVLPFQWNARQESMDDEDEFFDTVDSNNIPNLHIEEPLSRQGTIHPDFEDQQVFDSAPQPDAKESTAVAASESAEQEKPEESVADAPKKEEPSQEEPSKEAEDSGPFNFLQDPGFEPYKHLRHKMPIGKDDRPAMSLWSILKNNIGKDLTKISFPVAFNEPTSMLQRMSEDLEFSECLDAAALQSDATRRIMYVAAFAMSNYSSTIGRIAKPFNPMLGETFEYVSIDGQYRYISEQVSHHPPISACFCESPGWEYMGCVDAKSRFLGRSFEITPTGVAHARIKVKPEWIPAEKRDSLPSSPDKDGLLMEHYSWNKVTTSISGFITGSPRIDHFGDMNVVNHVTGEKCTLTFMPRGWRSSSAYEVNGHVTDASGKKVWDIAGRWNTQLLARRSNSQGSLNPDSKHSGADPVASSKDDNEYLLLWRNSEKKDTPFNLTPFAITLNSRPDGLMPWLPPTDCRLRPDLAAFEVGKFNEADKLKVNLENLQRATRRKREEGQLPPHKPRWFTKTTDPDTSAQFWQPHMAKDNSGRETMEYWIERERVGSKRIHNEPAEWEGCEPIFGDASK